jgi:hypothetical protein
MRVGQENDTSSEWEWCKAEKWLTAEELDVRLAAMLELLDEVEKFYSMSGHLAGSGLTLSNVWNSHKTIPARKNGLKGLTGFGAKMLRSGCHLLEQRLGREDCVMITLTVPTLGQRARKELAEQWGKVTSRLVQYLSRVLVKAGRTPAIAGCVEIQTARLERYREGYLHLHLVCPAHSNTGGRWAVDGSALRAWWAAEIERVIGTSLPNAPRIQLEIVEKSVEGYLGKYLSKGTGGELAAFVDDLGVESVPGQWWFMSAPLRDAVKQNTISGKAAGAVLDAMVNHLLEVGTGEGFDYIRHIDCMMNGRPVTVGFVGRLSAELRDELFGFCTVDDPPPVAGYNPGIYPDSVG